MNDGKITQEARFGGEPIAFDATSYVRCAGFRCLAYRDSAQRWRSYFGHELLPEVLEVLDMPAQATQPFPHYPSADELP